LRPAPWRDFEEFSFRLTDGLREIAAPAGWEQGPISSFARIIGLRRRGWIAADLIAREIWDGGKDT